MIKRKKRKFNFIKINEEDIVLSKKGLSSIVATLIIILLVIVVASIIWVVVKNVVQEGSEGVELGKFTLDLQIERAQIEDGDVTVVVVRRNPGKGDFIGMNFIFSDGENSEIIREDSVLQELEERSFTFTLTQISTSNLKTISIAPIFKLSSGKESVGDVTGSFDASGLIPIGANGDGEPMGNFEFLGFKGTGTVDYTISGGQGSINFTRAIVDPLDVLPGDNQTFTVHITSTYSIINVTSFTQLDNSNSTLVFEKISEDEIWSVNWIVNDTHITEYRTHVTAIDSEGNSNSITLTWTDGPCQNLVTHGQNLILDQECITGAYSVGGIDGGNLTISTGGVLILDMSSDWAFNDGKSIIMAGGTIAIGQAASIKKGNLFYTDADGDGYAPNSGLTFSTSPTLSGKVRAKDISVIPTTSAYTIDCCDSDANAKPYQTSYFTTERIGCGGYNYSCDPWAGQPEKQWTITGNCPTCYWEAEGICGQTFWGNVGWDGAVPACGVSLDYIIHPGFDCGSRSGQYDLCLDENCPGADIEYDRTQACR